MFAVRLWCNSNNQRRGLLELPRGTLASSGCCRLVVLGIETGIVVCKSCFFPSASLAKWRALSPYTMAECMHRSPDRPCPCRPRHTRLEHPSQYLQALRRIE